MLGTNVWPYVKSIFSNIVSVVGFDTQTIKQVIYKGAKRKAISVIASSEMLRFETEQQLDAFADTFGAAAVFGIRRRRPRKGYTDHLKCSEIFNVVAGLETPPSATRRRTTNDGIDLIFNGKILTVVVRYTKYVFNRSAESGLAEGCPTDIVANVINHSTARSEEASDADSSDDLAPTSICVGDTFEDKERGIIARVVEVNHPSVRCSIQHPRSRASHFITYGDYEQVLTMIREYN